MSYGTGQNPNNNGAITFAACSGLFAIVFGVAYVAIYSTTSNTSGYGYGSGYVDPLQSLLTILGAMELIGGLIVLLGAVRARSDAHSGKIVVFVGAIVGGGNICACIAAGMIKTNLPPPGPAYLPPPAIPNVGQMTYETSAASKFCPSCGQSILPQAMFCPNCGTAVANPAPHLAANPIKTTTPIQLDKDKAAKPEVEEIGEWEPCVIKKLAVIPDVKPAPVVSNEVKMALPQKEIPAISSPAKPAHKVSLVPQIRPLSKRAEVPKSPTLQIVATCPFCNGHVQDGVCENCSGWQCPTCGEMNYATAKTCQSCGQSL